MYYLQHRQMDKAKAVVDDLSAKFPTDPYTYFSSGMLAMAKNQHAQAIKTSHKAWHKFRALRRTAEGYRLY